MRQFLLQWLAESVSILLAIILTPTVGLVNSYPLANLYLALGWENYQEFVPLVHYLAAFIVLGFIYVLLDKYVKPVLIVLTGRLILTSMGFWLLALNVVVFWLFMNLSPWEFSFSNGNPFLWTVIAALIFTIIETVLRISVGVDQPKPVSEQENDRYWKLVERFSGGRRNMIVTNLRLKQVHDILLSFAAIIVLKRVPLLSSVRFQVYYWMYRQSDPITGKPVPEIVRIMLEFLGPTWVKFGQIVSSQADSLPDDWRQQMSQLQSEAAPFPWDEAERVIIQELGRPPEELFDSIDHAPLAAASTAQVHRAIVNGDEQVVVKIQRPNIQAKTNADLTIMLNLSNTLHRNFSWARQVNLGGMMREFTSGVFDEMDLRNESYHARRLGDNMKDMPGVKVPRIYLELSSQRVITQEFARGVKPTKLDVSAPGLDRACLAKNLTRALIKQVLFDGFFHGDPHPGNLLIDPETGVIYFIDCGLIGKLERDDRIAMIELMLAVSQKDPVGLAEVAEHLAVKTGPYDKEAFRQEAVSLGYKYLIYPRARVEFGEVMSALTGTLAKFGMSMPDSLTLAGKAIIQGGQSLYVLDPTLDLVTVGLQAATTLARGEFTREAVTGRIRTQLMVVGRGLVRRVPELGAATLSWLDQYQKGKLEVSVDTSSVNAPLENVSNTMRQATVAVLISGMIIGSAIATSAFATLQSSSWAWIISLGAFAFGASVLYGGIVAWRLVRQSSRAEKAASATHSGRYQGT